MFPGIVECLGVFFLAFSVILYYNAFDVDHGDVVLYIMGVLSMLIGSTFLGNYKINYIFFFISLILRILK